MIIIGQMGYPYGILGWIHVISFTEIKKNIFNYFPWYLDKSNIILTKNDICTYKKHTQNFILKIKNIHNRTQVSNIIKKNILIQYHQLPKLKNQEYYLNDIFSCKIVDLQKKEIGPIINITENKVYNILEILHTRTKKKIYIPFIQPNIIKKIDFKKKIIIASINTLYKDLIE